MQHFGDETTRNIGFSLRMTAASEQKKYTSAATANSTSSVAQPSNHLLLQHKMP
jgi:hypothetical protein